MFTADNANVVPLNAAPHVQARVRGSVIQVHADWLRDYGSRDQIIEMFEALDTPLRHQVLAAQPAHWYRFTTVIDLQYAICGRFGHGDVRFLERIGAYAAQKQLTPLREFLSRRRLHDFFTTIAVLHRDTLDFGSSDYENFDEVSGRMIVAGLGGAESYRAYLAGFYREAIAQHGGRDETIRESVPGIFEMSWR